MLPAKRDLFSSKALSDKSMFCNINWLTVKAVYWTIWDLNCLVSMFVWMLGKGYLVCWDTKRQPNCFKNEKVPSLFCTWLTCYVIESVRLRDFRLKTLTFKTQNNLYLATNKWVSQLIERQNKRLHVAFIMAGFTVQRERIEGLVVFNKIAVECFSLFT